VEASSATALFVPMKPDLRAAQQDNAQSNLNSDQRVVTHSTLQDSAAMQEIFLELENPQLLASPQSADEFRYQDFSI
jgi:hypothetical protein